MVDVAYIMGHGYSGSTLLTFLLGAHPAVATVGEMGIAPRAKTTPEEFLCSCRAPIRECPFWRAVTEAMARRGHRFDVWELTHDFRAEDGGIADVVLRAVQRGPLLETLRRVGLATIPTARRELARTLQFHQDLAHAILEVTGARVLVDASKRPERAVYLRRAAELDVRVIHLVRDGRAVACSAMRNLDLSADEAARSWWLDNRASEHARRWFPEDRWLTVRYEDLCRDPEGTLERVFGFVGLDPGERERDFLDVDHHVIGNRMRLTGTSEIRLDERWREALRGDDRRAVERIVAPLNGRYGYDVA